MEGGDSGLFTEKKSIMLKIKIEKQIYDGCLKAYGYNLADVKIKVSDISYRS